MASTHALLLADPFDRLLSSNCVIDFFLNRTCADSVGGARGNNVVLRDRNAQHTANKADNADVGEATGRYGSMAGSVFR